MTKRRRVTGGALTGGTGDVNPQYMHGVVTLKATDTITERAFNTPVVRIPKTGRATIMEVLKIFWLPEIWESSVATRHRLSQVISFSTIAQGETALTTFDQPNCFAAFAVEKECAFTATGSMNGYSQRGPLVYDLTDGAGHGFLIAGDRIFVQCDTAECTPAVYIFPFKILYRFKNVSLTEYIGIVQSQQ